ncbi:MAG: thiamine pyrophosphate-dependent enzyme, partial [Pseudomonadota bacterium]
MFDALQRNADSIRTYGARHEQGCGYMAFGYARATGRPGVFSVVPGPGVLNTTAALCTAMGCNAPVLCLTGQVPSAFMGKGRGHLHEIRDQLGTLDTLVKWTARIERPADAPEIINEAFVQMLSGRPGPVAVEMAWDTMAWRQTVPTPRAATLPPPPKPIASDIAGAVKLLKDAHNPMIFVGSGAQHAAEPIRELALAIGAPVAAFRGGRGIVPEDELLGASAYQAWKLWQDCDAVIGIGTRLELPYMRFNGMMTHVERPEAPPHVIRIDIDPAEMHRLRPHAAIVADAAEGTRALHQALEEDAKQTTGAPLTGASELRAAAIAKVKAEALDEIAHVQPQMDYLAALRDAIPDNGVLVTEVNQISFASYMNYPVKAPRTYITEGFQGNLGFGFPSALGVKVARADVPVVSIAGDGGFMYAVQELATAHQEQIALITVVFNNGAFGNVLRDQQMRFDNRVIGSTLTNPDFIALA